MLRVGITGGIGSGKSTVARIFGSMGVPIFYSDDVAKRIMVENPTVRARISETFGEDTYNGKELDRKLLASRVFGNRELLEKLNSIVHPAVRESFDEWVSHQKFLYMVSANKVLP